LATRLPSLPPGHRGLDRHYYESWLGRAINRTALASAAIAAAEPKGRAVKAAFGTGGLSSGTTMPTLRAQEEERREGKKRGEEEEGKDEASGGCAVAYSLADCQVGSCGTAKWAEARLTRAKKRLDSAFRGSGRG